MVMVMTISALHPAEKVGNWILGRKDLQIRFSSGTSFCSPTVLGGYLRIRSGANCDDGHRNNGLGDKCHSAKGHGDNGHGENGHNDGVSDGDHSTGSSKTSRFAMSM